MAERVMSVDVGCLILPPREGTIVPYHAQDQRGMCLCKVSESSPVLCNADQLLGEMVPSIDSCLDSVDRTQSIAIDVAITVYVD